MLVNARLLLKFCWINFNIFLEMPQPGRKCTGQAKIGGPNSSKNKYK